MKKTLHTQNKSGTLIARARKKKGINGSELCRRIGLTGLGLISMVENGSRRLPWKRINSVATELDIPAQKLFNAVAQDVKADLEI